MLIASLCLFALPLSHREKPVVFSSPLLEKAVREELEKENGEPVYEEDLAQITQLLICGDTVFHDISEHFGYQTYHTVDNVQHGYGDIADISILARMPNLTVVILDYQEIRDLTPLQGLSLTTLSLSGNPLRDLTALEGCDTLSTLHIAETPLTSLSPLTGCHNLLHLDCTDSAIASLAPIAQLPIRSLLIGGNPAKDFDSLTLLPLEEFGCSNRSVEELTVISSISTLKKLSAQDCGITSLKELAGFEQLTELELLANQIDSLEGLEIFSQLCTIDLSCNPVSDFSRLPEVQSLISLNLPDTVTDFSFLLKMPQLKAVIVKDSQKALIYQLIPDPWFEIRVL